MNTSDSVRTQPNFRSPAFIIAMDCEADAVCACLSDRHTCVSFGRRVTRGSYRGVTVAVYTGGIGKSNAAATAQLALSDGADLLINAGVAGGFDPSMEIAGVYSVSAAVEYDFDLADLNGTSVGTLDEYASPEIPLLPLAPFPGHVLATGDRFNDTEDDLDLLLDTLRIGLRDMEGAAVAHVARRAGLPACAFKAVSDLHGRGAMTGQYRANRERTLVALSAAVPQALDALLFGPDVTARGSDRPAHP